MVKKISFQDLILFENGHYIVIDKLPFLSTLEDRSDPQNVLQLARGYWEQSQVGHRIDKETSGVLVLAKNPEAYRNLAAQFEQRTVEKIYHAIVDGLPAFREMPVDLPIFKLSDGTVRIDRKGKSAQTYFSTLKTFRHHSLVECRPVTGRMHQIRIHLSSKGAPISGDTTYGGKPFFLSSLKRGFTLKKHTDEQPIMNRLALHSRSISFLDLTGSRVAVEAPYPKDFRALMSQLEKNP